MPGVQLSLFGEEPRRPSLRDVADVVRLSGADGLTDAVLRADQARYQEITVRSGLTRAMGMPFRWALNPYRGCTHACEYCYARKYQRHLELNASDQFSNLIFVKVNLPAVLAREVARPAWGREGVAIGTATDPYQPIEGHYRLTRRSLEVLVDAGTPFSIVTKGPMVVRDLDLLIRAGDAARVFMSVPSTDEAAWRQLEPGTAAPAQRLRAVRQLRDAGVDAGVMMMPLVPGLTTSRSSIEATLRAIADTGARFVGANVARFDPAVRAHFFAFLARTYPELVDGYERLYPGVSARQSYAARVKQLVHAAATKVGLR